MKLDSVVPFVRSLDEYLKMFALSSRDLVRRILGIADGPASFNAQIKAIGKAVVSIDPLYRFTGQAIQKQFDRVVDDIINQVKATPDDWVWTYHQSPDHLKSNRIAVLQRFLADYEEGKRDGRYLEGSLPALDFIEDDQFDLALCSHFLFLYSEQFDLAFHRASLYEMLRIAREVRVFPLLDLTRRESRHLEPLIDELKAGGYGVAIEEAGYELQRGGNQMLRIERIG